ncbi:MAG: hypothetical protein Q4A25_00035 [Candidatus Saccharibacteria bacterium]|nr:hypothetical protein [Candidatus Saccharibacteria bacterium]
MRVVAALSFGALVFLFIRHKEKYKLLINPIFWLLASWGFCLLLYLFSGIEYKYGLDIDAAFYVVGFLGLFTLGYYGGVLKFFLKLVARKNLRKYTQQKTNETKMELPGENYKKIKMVPLSIISIVSAILYATHVLLENNIAFGSTRNLELNWIDTFLLVLSCSSLVVWLYELAYSILTNKRLKIHAIMSAVAFNIPGLLASGRDALIIFGISTVIVSVYCGKLYRRNKNEKSKTYGTVKKYGLCFLVLGLAYLIFLAGARYHEGSVSSIELFSERGYCTFPPYLVWMFENLGGVGKMIVNFVFYYSSQFSKFNLVFANYAGPYMMGLYEFHYVSRLLPSDWGMSYTEVSKELARMLSNIGAGGIRSSWGTVLEYLIYDFSRIGGLVISYVAGRLVGIVTRFSEGKSDPMYVVVRAMLCVGCYITVAFSPVFDYFFIFPVAWLGIILIGRKIIYKRSKKCD